MKPPDVSAGAATISRSRVEFSAVGRSRSSSETSHAIGCRPGKRTAASPPRASSISRPARVPSRYFRVAHEKSSAPSGRTPLGKGGQGVGERGLRALEDLVRAGHGELDGRAVRDGAEELDRAALSVVGGGRPLELNSSGETWSNARVGEPSTAVENDFPRRPLKATRRLSTTRTHAPGRAKKPVPRSWASYATRRLSGPKTRLPHSPW